MGGGECSPSLKQKERYVGRGQVPHLQERRKRSFRSWDGKEVIKGVSVLSFPGGREDKNLPANAGDAGLIPGSG